MRDVCGYAFVNVQHSDLALMEVEGNVTNRYEMDPTLEGTMDLPVALSG